MNKIANFTRSFSSGRYLILVRQANLYKINIFSYTKISMKTLWIIWNLSGNPKKCGTRTPTNRDGWQRGAIADKFLIKAADIFDRYTSTSRLSRPSTNAQRVHQFREVAIESLAKSSMLTPWRNIKKEIKKMMRWERERRARKAHGGMFRANRRDFAPASIPRSSRQISTDKFPSNYQFFIKNT